MPPAPPSTSGSRAALTGAGCATNRQSQPQPRPPGYALQPPVVVGALRSCRGGRGEAGASGQSGGAAAASLLSAAESEAGRRPAARAFLCFSLSLSEGGRGGEGRGGAGRGRRAPRRAASRRRNPGARGAGARARARASSGWLVPARSLPSLTVSGPDHGGSGRSAALGPAVPDGGRVAFPRGGR